VHNRRARVAAGVFPGCRGPVSGTDPAGGQSRARLGGYVPDVGAGRTAATGGLRLQSNKSADRRPAARSPARPAGDAATKAVRGAERSCSRSVGTGLRRRSRSRRRCRTRSGRRGPSVGFHHGGPIATGSVVGKRSGRVSVVTEGAFTPTVQCSMDGQLRRPGGAPRRACHAKTQPETRSSQAVVRPWPLRLSEPDNRAR
jgi:hypothetical protein